MTFLSAEFGFRGAGLPWLLAMGAPSPGAPSAWVQLMPFVLVVGHLLFRHPAAHEAASAEGAGVSGGAEGRAIGSSPPAACSERSPGSAMQSIQVQVADKVRVEVSRNAVVGYQGQEPVAPESQS